MIKLYLFSFEDGAYLDLILLLDVSGDSNWRNYGQDAALKVIDDVRSDISLQNVHVSIITVSDGDSRNSAEVIEFYLNEESSYDYDMVVDAIRDIRERDNRDDVDFYAGFQAVSRVIERSSRSNVNKLIVFISSVATRQANRADAIQEAMNLQNSGYYIYGIWAERRRDVDRQDEDFMEAVVNLESNDILTYDEFDFGFGYFCGLVSCDASKFTFLRLLHRLTL